MIKMAKVIYRGIRNLYQVVIAIFDTSYDLLVWNKQVCAAYCILETVYLFGMWFSNVSVNFIILVAQRTPLSILYGDQDLVTS